MKNLTFSFILTLAPFWIAAQHLEVDGKVKITEMEKINSADSLVVWLNDSILGIRDASTINRQIIDSDEDTKVLVEETPDDDIIRFITKDSPVMIIDSTGHVGIGDTMPSESLTVKGGNILQQPVDPTLVGSLGIGGSLLAVNVSGRYAYVVDNGSDELKVIDVSDPSSPSLVGSLGIGAVPTSIYVSGRYAYVVDGASNDLKVIDVSDPSDPSIVGSLSIGQSPAFVYVSGHYAYVVDQTSNDLKVIDVSDRSDPSLAGRLVIGGLPKSLYVSGRYAYVVDAGSDDLKIIDVSDPSAPSLVGSPLSIGISPTSVYVSGRYAYVVDNISDDLKVIDVSDPNAPSLMGSPLSIGAAPTSVYVSGRYAYVVDNSSDDLKVIDVSDPSAPILVGSLGIGTGPIFVYVSGRYAYVVDQFSNDLKVIDVSGAEMTSMVAHSMEAGNLQVRNDIIAQGQLQITGGINVGSGGIYSDGNVGIGGQIVAQEASTYGQLAVGTQTPGSHELTIFDFDQNEDAVLELTSNSGSNTNMILGFNQSNQAWLRVVSNHNLGFFTNNSRRMTIKNTGEVGIGTDSPSEKLHVVGNICHTGSIGGCSDLRYKNILDPIGKALENIKQLRGVYYFWKTSEFPDHDFSSERQIGLIAQDVEPLFPELVMTDGDGYKSVDYSRLSAVLIEAVKEQQEMIDMQQQKINELEGIKDRLASLETMMKMCLKPTK